MHAVFVLPRFFPYRGGYENTILSFARSLVRGGHQATVFTTTANDLESLWVPGYRTFPAGEIAVDGIAIHRLPICYNALRRRATRVLGLVPYWRWKAQFWTPGFRIPGLREALNNSAADLIHIGPLPYNTVMYAGLHAAELRDLPVIATPCTHLGEDSNDQVSRFYIQPHLIAMLRRCDRVLCMTATEQQRLQQLGVSADHLAVIGHGIEVDTAVGGSSDQLREQYKIDGPVVLHLGMKAHEKGSIALVEAMQQLWKKGSKAWLVMAGPSLSAFNDYLAANAADCPRLVNLPPFEDSLKRDLLALADLVAQPSRVESLGLVVLEAWANGKPAIAADIAVSRELVAGTGGGLLVPFGDAAKLGEAIQTLLADPELRLAMGRRGQKKALSEYQSGSVFQRNAQEFERAVAEHARKPT